MTGRTKVLVVDDEPMIGRAIERALVTEHDVVVLDRAREALTRIEDGERFDVILCDLVMPEMTGLDLHHDLRKLAPDQAEAMVFMSAGAFNNRVCDFLDDVPNPRVDKPFDAGALRALVRSQIEKAKLARAAPSSHDDSRS